MTYNGYDNYATWNVCLWISSDEGLYHLSRHCACYDEFVETIRSFGTYETPDGISWGDTGLNVDQINKACFPEDADDAIELDTLPSIF
jgi:hypothetical protein